NAKGEPPTIRPHVDTVSPDMRRLALVELVKIDLERRWPRREWREWLEQYAAEYPELAGDDGLPADLIYEEFHVRKQHGESVRVEEYLERFPQQAGQLRALLAAERPGLTSSLAALPKVEDYEAGQQIDDFDLLAPLGEGAFGKVFLARQRTLGRLVALKISADRGFESQTLAKLDHPYIVRVFDQRRLADRRVQLMYMQYVAGGTLEGLVQLVRNTPPAKRSGKLIARFVDEQLDTQGESASGDSRLRQYLARLSWPQAVCWLAARLAEALEHAHSRGVLHRDLKPANVLMAADCTPKLADFDVSSCTLVPGATAAAFFGGSLDYMSPEQLDVFCGTNAGGPESVDARSDVFSLGVLVWELLTGQRPFASPRPLDLGWSSLSAAAERRRAGLTLEDHRRLPADCPRGMVDVLARCLAAQSERRFQTATALRRQFDLSLRSDVQDLLRPRRQQLAATLARHALALVVLAGVLPNLLASALSIAYSLREIVEQLNDPAAHLVFQIQVWTINPVCFAVGIAVLVGFAWPAVAAMRGKLGPTSGGDSQPTRARVRSTQLGDCVAAVSAVEWLLSGLLFPVWLSLALGEGALDSEQYLHFFASLALCGMLAATLAFFLTTLAALRVVTAALVDPDRDDEVLYRALERLAARTPIYSYCTFAVVPLAMIVMPLVHTRSRGAFIVLGIVGLAASGLAQFLTRRIQHSARALQRA
ncbi:MAG TPA: serine/threonine-protein kinase, partial [Pirellulales bacterium]|nr:serine/threonine-protein kinase [Pirellulales bacterium]